MNNVTRRSALRLVGLGAPAAQFVAEKVKSDMLLNAGIANIGAPNGAPATCDEVPPTKYSNFNGWLKSVGREAIKKEARWIQGFDADLIDMHLPLATKVRMQRARNCQRVLDERQQWFAKKLNLNGFVKWWD